MGFLDKLKSVKNMVTGGAAKVYLEVGDAKVDEPIPVRVKVQVDDADLKIDAVYIEVRGSEEIEIDGKTVERTIRNTIEDFTSDGRLNGIIEREETCDIRKVISEAQTLSANESYEFEGEIELPPGSMPTYRGRHCKHVYRFLAGLDAFGNDPDSGSQEVIVK